MLNVPPLAKLVIPSGSGSEKSEGRSIPSAPLARSPFPPLPPGQPAPPGPPIPAGLFFLQLQVSRLAALSTLDAKEFALLFREGGLLSPISASYTWPSLSIVSER